MTCITISGVFHRSFGTCNRGDEDPQLSNEGKEWRVGRDAELVQAVEGFRLIVMVRVIANEPEQADESFRIGFAVVHGSANIRQKNIEGSVERGNHVFGASKCSSEALVQHFSQSRPHYSKSKGSMQLVCVKIVRSATRRRIYFIRRRRG